MKFFRKNSFLYCWLFTEAVLSSIYCCFINSSCCLCLSPSLFLALNSCLSFLFLSFSGLFLCLEFL